MSNPISNYIKIESSKEIFETIVSLLIDEEKDETTYYKFWPAPEGLTEREEYEWRMTNHQCTNGVCAIVNERVSSGSFPIKDSAKLTELYRKKRDYYDNVAKTIELEPIDVHTQWFPQNLCGCIDVGVYMTCHERLRIIDGFIDDKKCEKISSILKEYKYDYSISLIGARILITIAKQSGKDNNGNPITLAGGVQNFLEILKDGSFRYRILLALDKDGDRASITSISLLSHIYSLIYQELVGDDFQNRFIYSEKCEKLSVFRQFTPYYYLDDKNSQEVIQAHRQLSIDHANTLGGNSIVIGNRFPSTGYSHYDHALFDEYGIKWETQSIIGNLFATVFDNLGYVDTAKWEQ